MQGVHVTKSTQEAATSWGDSSSQKEKPRNADFFAAVRGMLYDVMKAYFYDMKTSEDKGKGKANWMNRASSSQVRIDMTY